MLVVETIAKIRREHLRHGKGVKTIARELGLSRNTVRKVLRSGETSFVYKRASQPRPKLGAFKASLEAMLEGNVSCRPKERLTLLRITERLQAEGYVGGYDAVRRFAAQWESQNSAEHQLVEAFVPLRFGPGEAYQFDWSSEQVELGGRLTSLKVAHFRLCHSRRFLVRAYRAETQEMLFDAHAHAFALLGGVAERGIYDNMKTAVDSVLVGKERRFNNRFQEMCSHYLVEPVACTPSAGWEKGQVESQVRYVRDNLFRPRLKFDTLADLNLWLEAECERRAKQLRHPEMRDRSVWEVFEAERAALAPVSGQFDGYRQVDATAQATCLIAFEGNRYSVEAWSARRRVQIRAYRDRVKVLCQDRLVADHPRSFERDQTVYDPWHYLPVLLRKPGALRNGAPFQNWRLPPGLAQLRVALGSGEQADRRFVRVLSAVLEHGLETVERHVRQAIEAGIADDEAIVRNLNSSARYERLVVSPPSSEPAARKPIQTGF